MDYKYKVGDKVRVRKDLVKLGQYFMEGHQGDPAYRNTVVDDMMMLRGKVVTIASQDNRGYRIKEMCYSWTNEMLEDIGKEQKIVITTDGMETHATLYEGKKPIKTAKAKCAPDDTFDFDRGARLAFDPLMGVEERPVEQAAKTPEAKWRVVRRAAKVCDYIRLKVKSFSFNEIGDILKVDVVKPCNMVSVYGRNHNRDTRYSDMDWNYILDSECEIVEPVNPEKTEFTPHLVWRDRHHGNIGDPTNYKDAIGRPLCIGDTVEVYDDKQRCLGEHALVKSALPYRDNQEKAYVLGIEMSCNDETGATGEFNILKKRSHEDIQNGEEVGLIRYVKERA